MEMLTVRFHLSIEEFEGGSELFDQVDCWFVERGHPPLLDLDDESDADTASFAGSCTEGELEELERLVQSLPWRVGSAAVVSRVDAQVKEAG